MLTSHGWKIPDTAAESYVIEQFEQCGGPGNCEQCTTEAAERTNVNAKQITEQHFHMETTVPAELPTEIVPDPRFVPIPVPEPSKDEV